MQKNMRVFTKGIKKIRDYDLYDSEDQDLSGYKQINQFVKDCLISPNQQYLAIIQTLEESSREGFQCQILIKIVNLISDLVLNSKIKTKKLKYQITSQFSTNSQYLVVLTEAQLIIINIFDKLKYRLNYEIKDIISIDSNQILQLRGQNQILFFSLAQKQLIKQIDWKHDKYFRVIEIIGENIFIVQKLLNHQFQIIFQQKILKTTFSKLKIYFFHDNTVMISIDCKWLSQQLLVVDQCQNPIDVGNVYLYNLKISKIVRKFQNYYPSNSLSEEINRKITNTRNNTNSYYIYYLDQEKKQTQWQQPQYSKDKIFRFNLLNGVNRQLYFRPKVIFDQVILSENVYSDIQYDDRIILRHYYYKK